MSDNEDLSPVTGDNAFLVDEPQVNKKGNDFSLYDDVTVLNGEEHRADETTENAASVEVISPGICVDGVASEDWEFVAYQQRSENSTNSETVENSLFTEPGVSDNVFSDLSTDQNVNSGVFSDLSTDQNANNGVTGQGESVGRVREIDALCETIEQMPSPTIEQPDAFYRASSYQASSDQQHKPNAEFVSVEPCMEALHKSHNDDNDHIDLTDIEFPHSVGNTPDSAINHSFTDELQVSNSPGHETTDSPKTEDSGSDLKPGGFDTHIQQVPVESTQADGDPTTDLISDNLNDNYPAVESGRVADDNCGACDERAGFESDNVTEPIKSEDVNIEGLDEPLVENQDVPQQECGACDERACVPTHEEVENVEEIVNVDNLGSDFIDENADGSDDNVPAVDAGTVEEDECGACDDRAGVPVHEDADKVEESVNVDGLGNDSVVETLEQDCPVEPSSPVVEAAHVSEEECGACDERTGIEPNPQESDVEEEVTPPSYPESDHAEPEQEVHAEPEQEDHAEPKQEVHAEPEQEFHAEPEQEVHAEPEQEVHTELEQEVHAELEKEVHAEPEQEVHAEPEQEDHAEPKQEISVEPELHKEPEVDATPAETELQSDHETTEQEADEASIEAELVSPCEPVAPCKPEAVIEHEPQTETQIETEICMESTQTSGNDDIPQIRAELDETKELLKERDDLIEKGKQKVDELLAQITSLEETVSKLQTDNALKDAEIKLLEEKAAEELKAKEAKKSAVGVKTPAKTGASKTSTPVKKTPVKKPGDATKTPVKSSTKTAAKPATPKTTTPKTTTPRTTTSKTTTPKTTPRKPVTGSATKPATKKPLTNGTTKSPASTPTKPKPAPGAKKTAVNGPAKPKTAGIKPAAGTKTTSKTGVKTEVKKPAPPKAGTGRNVSKATK